MITRDLRRAIARAVAAAGFERAVDPGLRPTGTPGQYAASVALTLGSDPRETAGGLAGTLIGEDWVETAEVAGPGYLTITVTSAALAAVADTIVEAGPACVASDALAGVTVPAPPPGDPLDAPTWEEAKAVLAARLTARLAAAAGATVADIPDTERVLVSRQERSDAGTRETRSRSADPQALRAAAAFAGRDAVVFTLARAVPGKRLRVEPEMMARHVPGNPAYAVRYAHARAAFGVRWAVISRGSDPPYSPLSRRHAGAAPWETTVVPCPPADPGELALLDALSWLPERVVTAARRGRPDEFARYLEDLAGVTIDVLSSTGHPGEGAPPGSGRLTLAKAARAGLAAGLSLLEISAPERL